MTDERPAGEGEHATQPSAPTIGDYGISPKTLDRIEQNDHDVNTIIKIGELMAEYPTLLSSLNLWVNNGATQTRLRILRHLCVRYEAGGQDATYDSLKDATGLTTNKGIRKQLNALEDEVRSAFIGDDAEVAWLNETPVGEVDDLVVSQHNPGYHQPKEFSLVNRDVYEIAEVVCSMANRSKA